jgi:hypothetical protein
MAGMEGSSRQCLAVQGMAVIPHMARASLVLTSHVELSHQLCGAACTRAWDGPFPGKMAPGTQQLPHSLTWHLLRVPHRRGHDGLGPGGMQGCSEAAQQRAPAAGAMPGPHRGMGTSWRMTCLWARCQGLCKGLMPVQEEHARY